MKVLIFPMKNWSKRKFSEVPKFSIWSKGQNQKPGNLRNWQFFSNHIVTLKFFLLGYFFNFEWVSYTTKNLSKIQLSEISKFSILDVGQNQKPGNLRNWQFFSNHIVTLKFFLLGYFFNFEWVSYTTKNLSKIQLSEISKFSILDVGQNQKLGNLGNCYFFLIKPQRNVIYIFF